MAKKQEKDPFGYLLLHRRQNIYFALDELRLDFTTRELKILFLYWIEGFSVFYISEKMNRDLDEVTVLIMDLAGVRCDYIPTRDRGAFTSTRNEKFWFYERRFERFIKNHPDGYTAFQNRLDIDFVWDEREVIKFQGLWNEGYTIHYIEEKLNRNQIDLALLVIDRARKGYIESRKDGLKGWKEDDHTDGRRKGSRVKSAVGRNG